ncbi:MAG: MFS transporter [Bacteroidales bacterium]|nr:MFS transporter [Bacteroidales bacterium]
MKKSLIALSLGTFVLGISEFIMPGILSFVAKDLNINIPQAGHLISAYALGVSFGARIILLSVEKYRLKSVIIFLACLMLLGNLLASFAPNYYSLLACRFISGLPHGAYFGVSTIIASKLADKGRESSAIAIMVSGMTIANLLGVPIGTFLSHNLSWRMIFAFVGFLALLAVFAFKLLVPDVENQTTERLLDRFKFLKHLAPWLIVGATFTGNCGIFCMYSYINPILTEVAGFQESSLSILMIIAGLGMVLGNLISGRICDKYPMGLVAGIVQGLAAVFLLIIYLFSFNQITAVVMMFLSTFCLFALSSPQQLLIIKHGKGGEKLGGALVQVAFNVGNAVGAFLGGLPILQGYNYNHSALSGIPFGILGFSLFMYFHFRYERKQTIQS